MERTFVLFFSFTNIPFFTVCVYSCKFYACEQYNYTFRNSPLLRNVRFVRFRVYWSNDLVGALCLGCHFDCHLGKQIQCRYISWSHEHPIWAQQLRNTAKVWNRMRSDKSSRSGVIFETRIDNRLLPQNWKKAIVFQEYRQNTRIECNRFKQPIEDNES